VVEVGKSSGIGWAVIGAGTREAGRRCCSFQGPERAAPTPTKRWGSRHMAHKSLTSHKRRSAGTLVVHDRVRIVLPAELGGFAESVVPMRHRQLSGQGEAKLVAVLDDLQQVGRLFGDERAQERGRR
jgi:hypothetical protein